MANSNYFDSSTVLDGVPVTSTINSANLVTSLQTAHPGDTYFDATNKIGYVKVYYTHEAGRQQKILIHDPSTHQVSVQWSPYAQDGTWQKNQIKAYDKDGATLTLARTDIGSEGDLTHADGTTNLNVS